MAYEINFCETKEQLKHLAEVASGKVDGSPSGADIDESTLPYTGQVRRTLPKLIDQFDQQRAMLDAEAEEAIDTYRRINAGDYSSGPLLLDDKFTYATYNGGRFYAISPPYTTDPTTFPDPSDDTVNLKEISLLDEQTMRAIANQTAEQILDGEIFPSDYDQALQVGDPLNGEKYVNVLEGATIRTFGVNAPIVGSVDSIDVSTMSAVVSGTTIYFWRQNIGVDKLSAWMPEGMIENIDCLPYLERAYAHNKNTVINDFGGSQWVMTLTTKTIEGRTYPAGLLMDLEGHGVTFDDGVKMTMNTVVGGRYSMFIGNAKNAFINQPYLIGDKDTHLVDTGAPVGQDEQGYGIRVEEQAEAFRILNPTTIKMWGDGILWLTTKDKGYIGGKHYAYDCRRQGISVIKCGGLRIDHTVGEEIGLVNGAENGPWATIDVEPDQPSQAIQNLSIGTVEGINNKGVCCLLALLKLDDTAPFVDITIDNILSRGCLRAFEPRVDNNMRGKIHIKYINGKNSFNQDFQTVAFNDSCSLEIEKFVSYDCNKQGLTSSIFATPIGIYKNFATQSKVGNIRIRSLDIINPTTSLQHPVSMVNQFDAATFGEIIIDEINQNQAVFLNGAVHNPAGASFKTNSKVRKSFATSGTLNNSEWANTIDNVGASGTVVVTVPTGWGYEGQKIYHENIESGTNLGFYSSDITINNYTDYVTDGTDKWRVLRSVTLPYQIDSTTYPDPSTDPNLAPFTPELRIVYQDKLERSTVDVRSITVGSRLTSIKSLNTWAVSTVDTGQWSQGGYGYYGYGMSAGGSTANRPINPTPWMTYADVTVGKQIAYRPDLASWVLADDLNTTV